MNLEEKFSHPDVGKRNALESAAPDLFAALRGLIGVLHQRCNRCDWNHEYAPKHNCNCNHHAAYDAARAAIAKAEGAA